MTGNTILDWATMAVSLFNTILLLWLGLTVLLNAEQRTWGIWLAGGGLLLGGAFFISHTAILGRGLSSIGPGMDFWWRLGWGPVVALPFVWYLIILWYAGFWDDRRSSLRRRHRPWLLLTSLLAVGLVGLLFFANPLPSYWQVAQLDLSATPSVGNIPLLILVYPIYIVLCIGLSLDALRYPGPSARMMGDLARRRARPWLVATSVALLLVSLLVAWAMLWIVLNARQRALNGLYNEMALTVAWFDLIIASLIAVAVLLQGQAIVSYEVFTGKTLPRRGLWRHWRSAIVLAGGYSAVVALSLALQLRPIYSLLLSTVLMAIFYALFSWRSYEERERTMAQLRPFVASQRLYEQLLTPSSPPEVDTSTPFRALCEDVLGARVAFLVPLGSLAPLVGLPLTYPDHVTPPSLPPTDIAARFDSPQAMCLPLDPDHYGGARWAVPLCSERGLVGAFLLGEKQDGSLYTQEEIEIARASGERLIDTQASAEMARRLMALQRRQLAEGQVLDRQARRVLHDDVLPHLHTAMLSMTRHFADQNGSSSDVVALLGDVHRQLSDLLREMPTSAAPELARLGLIDALRKTVEDELASAFDDITWEVEPEAEHQAQAIPPLTAEVLFYAAREAIRNAARYGRGGDGTRPLRLRVGIGWHDPSTGSGRGPSTGSLASAPQVQAGHGRSAGSLASASQVQAGHGPSTGSLASAPQVQPGHGRSAGSLASALQVQARQGPTRSWLGELEIVIEDDGVGLKSEEEVGGGGGQGLALHSTMMAVVGGALAVESVPDTFTRVSLTLPQARRQRRSHAWWRGFQ